MPSSISFKLARGTPDSYACCDNRQGGSAANHPLLKSTVNPRLAVCEHNDDVSQNKRKTGEENKLHDNRGPRSGVFVRGRLPFQIVHLHMEALLTVVLDQFMQSSLASDCAGRFTNGRSGALGSPRFHRVVVLDR